MLKFASPYSLLFISIGMVFWLAPSLSFAQDVEYEYDTIKVIMLVSDSSQHEYQRFDDFKIIPHNTASVEGFSVSRRRKGVVSIWERYQYLSLRKKKLSKNLFVWIAIQIK